MFCENYTSVGVMLDGRCRGQRGAKNRLVSPHSDCLRRYPCPCGKNVRSAVRNAAPVLVLASVADDDALASEFSS